MFVLKSVAEFPVVPPGGRNGLDVLARGVGQVSVLHTEVGLSVP